MFASQRAGTYGAEVGERDGNDEEEDEGGKEDDDAGNADEAGHGGRRRRGGGTSRGKEEQTANTGCLRFYPASRPCLDVSHVQPDSLCFRPMPRVHSTQFQQSKLIEARSA